MIMSSRVEPIDDQEMTTRSIAEQPGSINVFSNDDSIPPEREHVNKHLFNEMDELCSPVLKLMKLFGIYYGDTTLKSLKNCSDHNTKNNYLSLTYCAVVTSGLWFNFILAFLGCFFSKAIYVFLMFSAWCLSAALNGTIFLTVSPLKATGKSRFDKFLRCAVTLKSQVSLQKVKSMSRYGMIVFFLVVSISNVGAMVTYLKLNMTLASFEPFNQSLVSPIVSVSFLMIGAGVWLLPILKFCITCLLIIELFDDLRKRMSSQLLHSASMELAPWKKEHYKLCEVVELADEMFSPLLFGMVAVFIPLICFNSYLAVNVPEETAGGRSVFWAINIFYLVVSACDLAIVLLFGSKVSEKIHSFQKILQTFPVLKEDEGKLMMFMFDLQGDPKGFSVGGLAVITKSLSLTIVGVIASYFAVMLSLPK